MAKHKEDEEKDLAEPSEVSDEVLDGILDEAPDDDEDDPLMKEDRDDSYDEKGWE